MSVGVWPCRVTLLVWNHSQDRADGFQFNCHCHVLFPFSLPAAAPVFTNVATDGSTTATVLENAAVEDVIMTLTATDTDTGDTLTYSLVTASAEFKVVGQELRVKAATLDYETTQSYVLTVR